MRLPTASFCILFGLPGWGRPAARRSAAGQKFRRRLTRPAVVPSPSSSSAMAKSTFHHDARAERKRTAEREQTGLGRPLLGLHQAVAHVRVSGVRSRSRHQPSPVAGFAEHRGVAPDGSVDAQARGIPADHHELRRSVARADGGARPISAVAARPTSQPAMLAVSPRPSCSRRGSLLASSSCRSLWNGGRPVRARPGAA